MFVCGFGMRRDLNAAINLANSTNYTVVLRAATNIQTTDGLSES